MSTNESPRARIVTRMLQEGHAKIAAAMPAGVGGGEWEWDAVEKPAVDLLDAIARFEAGRISYAELKQHDEAFADAWDRVAMEFRRRAA